MKKDFIQELLITLLAKRKERLEDKKIMKKKYESLSLVDRNAYEQMIDKRNTSHFYIFTAPFYAAFYIGLFGLVMKYAFDINLLVELKTLTISILGFIPIFILAWLLFLSINLIQLNNTKRELLLKK